MPLTSKDNRGFNPKPKDHDVDWHAALGYAVVADATFTALSWLGR